MWIPLTLDPDGPATIRAGVARAVADHATHAGIATTHTLAWHPQFVRECRAQGVIPILGERLRVACRHDGTFATTATERTRWSTVTFWAENAEGWANLLELHNLALTTPQGPGLTWDQVSQCAEGLIVGTGGADGPVAFPLKNGHLDAATANYDTMRAAFDRVCVELRDHANPDEEPLLGSVVQFAATVGAVPIVTCDELWPTPGDRPAWMARHDASGARDPAPPASEVHHVRTEADMRAIRTGPRWQRAIDDTILIAGRVASDVFDDPDVLPPAVPEDWWDEPARPLRKFIHAVSAGIQPSSTQEPPFGVTRFPRVMPLSQWRAVTRRVAYEARVLYEEGFVPYMLLVAELCKSLRDEGVLVGPGRGSVCGSLCAYLLGITDIDPLEAGLSFDRFLTKGRASLPDIDVDVQHVRLDDARALLADICGSERVIRCGEPIIVGPRRALLDAARMRGLSDSDGHDVANLIPAGTQKRLADYLRADDAEGARLRALMRAPLEEAARLQRLRALVFAALGVDDVPTLSTDPTGWMDGWIRDGDTWIASHAPGRAQQWARAREELVTQRLSDIVRVALALDGSRRGTSAHPCAMIASADDVDRVLPFAVAGDGSLVVEWSGEECAALGWMKLDLLASKALTALDEWAGSAQVPGQARPDPLALPPEGSRAWGRALACYQTGRLDGVFQNGSSGMKQTAMGLCPGSFADVALLQGMYRPGVLQGAPDGLAGPAVDWGADEATRAVLGPILVPTRGRIVWQEQAMELAHRIAGFDAARQHDLRKALGGPAAHDFLPEWVQGSRDVRSVPESTARRVWETLEAVGGYLFAKAHAWAYARLSFATAVAKTTAPHAWWTAQLRVADTAVERARVLAGARRDHVPILAPDINASDACASVCASGVRLGLSDVRSVGSHASTLLAVRAQNGEFRSFADALRRAPDIPRDAWLDLVRGGAFDAFGPRLGQAMVVDVGGTDPPPVEWTVDERALWEQEALNTVVVADVLDGRGTAPPLDSTRTVTGSVSGCAWVCAVEPVDRPSGLMVKLTLMGSDEVFDARWWPRRGSAMPSPGQVWRFTGAWDETRLPRTDEKDWVWSPGGFRVQSMQPEPETAREVDYSAPMPWTAAQDAVAPVVSVTVSDDDEEDEEDESLLAFLTRTMTHRGPICTPPGSNRGEW